MSTLIVDMTDEKSIPRLANIFEEKFKGTKWAEVVIALVDQGEEKTIDYYQGAAKIAVTTIQNLNALKLSKENTTNLSELWAVIFSYICHKLVKLQRSAKKDQVTYIF